MKQDNIEETEKSHESEKEKAKNIVYKYHVGLAEWVSLSTKNGR
jgi:hypothetical protein